MPKVLDYNVSESKNETVIKSHFNAPCAWPSTI